MVSISSRKANLFLTLNLLFYVLTASACSHCGRPSYPSPTPGGGPGGPSFPFPPPGTPPFLPGTPPFPPGGTPPGTPTLPPGGTPPGTPTLPPGGNPPGTPTVPPGGNPPGTPTVPPGGTPPGTPPGTCPRDALKLGVCANLLGGLVGVVIGNPPTTPCCSLLAGLVDLEAAVCLCTAIRANVLGINLNVPVALSLLLNVCGRTPPTGFTCG